jgi:hypothetical protein
VNQPSVTSVVATIATGAALSDTIFTGGLPICAIYMPAGWDAADLTFQASCDVAANAGNVYDKDGLELNFKVAAGNFITFDPSYFAGVRYIKARSGTSITPVNQTATRSIVLAIRTV